MAPLVIAGFVALWRTPELRFIAVAATLILVYVLAWIPGKVYYADGMAPAVLAAGPQRPSTGSPGPAAPRLAALAGSLRPWSASSSCQALPVLPVGAVHTLSATAQQSSDSVTPSAGRSSPARSRRRTRLLRAGHPPTAIFTGYYGEAAALGVLGVGYHLPPVLSGHNAYWMWGPGRQPTPRCSP